MSVATSQEPARAVGHVVAVILTGLGAGFLAVNAAWTGAPYWFHLLSIGVPAGLGAVGVKVGTEKVRSVVYPAPTVDRIVSTLNHAQPAPVVPTNAASTVAGPPPAPMLVVSPPTPPQAPPAPSDTPPPPPPAPVAPTVDLDAAVKAAGLT